MSAKAVGLRIAVVALLVASCADPVKSDEYQALLVERDAALDRAATAEERATTAEGEAASAQEQSATVDAHLADLTSLVEDFMSLSFELAGVSEGEAGCLIAEVGAEGMMRATLALATGEAGAVESLDPTLLGEITQAGITCGATDAVGGLFGTNSAAHLEVGDCFDDLDGLPVVDCDQPHDNEVYFEFEMEAGRYPGDDGALELVFDVCLDEFQPFVGSTYELSDLDIYPLPPTAADWELGDRVARCAVYALDYSKLTGSMEGVAH